MRTLFCFLCLALGFQVTAAEAGYLAQFAYFGPTSVPNNLSVELRTAGNDLVRWDANNLSPNVIDAQLLEATATTAASFGIDWNAWSAAIIDPNYNRILFTFGGVTVEKPWPLFPSLRNNYTTLNKLALTVVKWQTQPQIELIARDAAITPEPASWLIVLCAIGFHVRRRPPGQRQRGRRSAA